MPDWVVIADDLTGACDSGAAFAARGWTVQVGLSGHARELKSQVWVITTESRALSGQDAERAVEAGLRSLLIPEDSRIYKKIDSTLRGNPAEELRAVMRVLGLDRALITPAFPAQGRVVKAGRVWVNQVALEETPVGREVQEFNLASLFRRAAPVCEVPFDLVRQGADSIARLLARKGPILFTADAETDADLRQLAQAGMQAGLRLFCGSAGLAHALTAGRQVRAQAVGKWNGPVLVAAGSRNPATQRQVAYARQQGMPVFTPSMDDLLSVPGRSRSIQIIRDLLARGESVILSAELIPFMPGKESDGGSLDGQPCFGKFRRYSAGRAGADRWGYGCGCLRGAGL